MYDFNEKTGAGEQYHRAHKIVFNNPLQAKKDPMARSVTYFIEEVTNTADGNAISREVGWLDAGVAVEDEREEVVDLVDLEGNVLGQMPLGNMSDKTMLFINSMMIHIHKRKQKALEERQKELANKETQE